MKAGCYAVVAMSIIFSLPCCSQQSEQSHNYALIIGISGYPNFPESDRLRYASADAALFAETIQSGTGISFTSQNVHVLRDQDATFDRIQDEITWLQEVPNADRVYVFFSGHGLLDKFDQAWFIPWDGHEDNPMKHGIRADNFLSDLRNIRSATLVIFIDACHAAAAFNPGGIKGADNVSGAVLRDSQVFSDRPLSGEEQTMIWVSSGSDEKAREDDQLKAGLFTYFLTRGITGAAGAKGSNGPVTAPDLFEYVLSQVKAASAGKQNVARSGQMDPAFQFAKVAQISGEGAPHISSIRVAHAQEFRADHIGSGHRISSGTMKIYPDMIWYASSSARDNFVFPLADIEEVRQNKGLPGTTEYTFHIKSHSGLTYNFQYLNDIRERQLPDPIIEAIDRAVVRARPSGTDYPVIVTDGNCRGCTGRLQISSGKMSFECKNSPEWSFSASLAAISPLKSGNSSDLKIEVPNVNGKKRVYGFTFQGDPHKRPPARAIEEEIRRAHIQDRSSIDADQTLGRPGTALLPINTAIPLRFLQSICSSSAAKGAVVPFEVTNNISADGYVVIPQGTTINGELSDARHKRSFGRRGFLRIRLETIVAPDGQVIPVIGSNAVRGNRWSQEENTVMQGLNQIPQAGPPLAIAYWIAAPGQDVGIQEGQTMRAYTLEDVAVNTATLAPDSGTDTLDLEHRLAKGEELTYQVDHVRSWKNGNPGILRISSAGVSFSSDHEDEVAKFAPDDIKSVGEEPSMEPCQMPDLALTPKKGKRYTFLIKDDGRPAAPDQALRALEWLLHPSNE